MFGRNSAPEMPPLTLPTVSLVGDADPIQIRPPAATPAPEADGLGGVVDRLARLGSRGARAAADLLVEQGSLALGDARREEMAAKRQARGDARRARLEALAPGVVYTLAIGFAVGGQVTGLVRRMDPGSDLAMAGAVLAGVGAAGLIEGSGLAFAILVRRAALAGRRAYAARSMMYLSTAAACALNAWGHWGSIWAYPCTLGSVVALVLWVVETAHRCADQLAEAKGALRRQAAIRALATTAMRRSHGRRIAGIVTATMDPATLERLAVNVVDPATVAEAAIGRYVAAHDKATKGGGWRPWRRSSTPPLAHRVTATVGEMADANGGHLGGLADRQMAELGTATDDAFWRDAEQQLADAMADTEPATTPQLAGMPAAETAGVAGTSQPAIGGDPWRHSRPLMAVPNVATGDVDDDADVADMAAARTTRRPRQDKRSAKAAKRGTKADKVAAVWQKNPAIKPKECAALAGVSQRTAERVLAALRDGAADAAAMAKAN